MRGRVVQVGRVCVINYGPKNELCTIIDIVDHNKVLVDGPRKLTGVPRQLISLKRLSLTPFTLNISHGIHEKYLTKKLKKEKVLERFSRSSWGKKLAKRKRVLTETDFDRFVSMKKHRQSKLGIPKKLLADKQKEQTKRISAQKAKKEKRKAHKK
ncbi:MAG: putative 60 ribosomal protein L14 [Streblomastix strix]|uniref:Putative 60 ribosomal protein L14 n=1 Tax=Streblomastix strix TaxID=222440 RepID=A0A5J4VE89_9EUKA|nr:MAG: putative 60 ribosomal protein L14 [Streblomastix strix]